MAVSDRIRDIRKRNGMSQIAKALNVLAHYLIDWAEDADALASANALSPEALLWPEKELLTCITNHEAARIAASEPDELEISRRAIDAAIAANVVAPERPESTG